jgi:hypothetical protein
LIKFLIREGVNLSFPESNGKAVRGEISQNGTGGPGRVEATDVVSRV